HVRRKTVNWRLVRWLMIGSIPSAFTGAFLLDEIVGTENAGTIKKILGWVLIVAASAIVAKLALQAHRKTAPVTDMMDQALVRPIPTLIIGAIGGLIVGMTSVGSGSLIIVALMLLYPKLSAKEMVGTDLIQAIPLVGSAAVGHLLFGTLNVSIISSVLIGAIPAVVLGAHFSSKGTDRYVRPVLVAVLTISALGLLSVPNSALLAVSVIALVLLGLVFHRMRRADLSRAAAPEQHTSAMAA
ncbi:MAG: putative permease, partial [Ilumatobacteraceae bacterium]|nr:putative permease [Ilumatobacteraceae bacterium]